VSSLANGTLINIVKKVTYGDSGHKWVRGNEYHACSAHIRDNCMTSQYHRQIITCSGSILDFSNTDCL